MAFTSLGRILPRRLRQAGIDRAVEASQIIALTDSLLNKWFGENTTESRAKAMSVKHRAISIASMDAAMRQQLRMKERDFIAEINKQIGSNQVERIRIIV